MRPLTVGSLFSGIGGIDLGLERTGGFTIVWQVEIDDYCQQVLAQHWPDVTRFRDIRTVGMHQFIPPPVDVLVGGFPCQDISASGKRAGLQGERSGLWSHFLRLIGELRPRYVLVENVAALLAPFRKRKRIVGPAPLATVLGGLAAGGYDAEWEVLPASAFGAPHLRERLFLVAYPHRERLQALQPQPCVFPETAPTWQDVLASSRGALTWRQNRERLLWQAEPDVDRVVDGVPDWMERIQGLGNAVVPQVAQFVGECILASEDALLS